MHIYFCRTTELTADECRSPVSLDILFPAFAVRPVQFKIVSRPFPLNFVGVWNCPFHCGDGQRFSDFFSLCAGFKTTLFELSEGVQCYPTPASFQSVSINPQCKQTSRTLSVVSPKQKDQMMIQNAACFEESAEISCLELGGNHRSTIRNTRGHCVLFFSIRWFFRPSISKNQLGFPVSNFVETTATQFELCAVDCILHPVCFNANRSDGFSEHFFSPFQRINWD